MRPRVSISHQAQNTGWFSYCMLMEFGGIRKVPSTEVQVVKVNVTHSLLILYTFHCQIGDIRYLHVNYIYFLSLGKTLEVLEAPSTRP